MARTVKYRGLRKDGKGFAYGVPFYIHPERKCFIVDNCLSSDLTQEGSSFSGREVHYNSVGEFTGFSDDIGTEIYEGDSVLLYTDSLSEELGACKGEWTTEVVWVVESAAFKLRGFGFGGSTLLWSFYDRDFNGFKFRKKVITTKGAPK